MQSQGMIKKSIIAAIIVFLSATFCWADNDEAPHFGLIDYAFTQNPTLHNYWLQSGAGANWRGAGWEQLLGANGQLDFSSLDPAVNIIRSQDGQVAFHLHTGTDWEKVVYVPGSHDPEADAPPLDYS